MSSEQLCFPKGMPNNARYLFRYLCRCKIENCISQIFDSEISICREAAIRDTQSFVQPVRGSINSGSQAGIGNVFEPIVHIMIVPGTTRKDFIRLVRCIIIDDGYKESFSVWSIGSHREALD